ncbi:hypothetical protein C1H46_025281 [Malus baccata]|uniref:Uncharacterized protein n=1 Tax=Malus baccata TaxID=106549 RepID=A0A540LS60_MALBA|nr:hypothetical protein C1H46_025281 [Malus baccata]
MQGCTVLVENLPEDHSDLKSILGEAGNTEETILDDLGAEAINALLAIPFTLASNWKWTVNMLEVKGIASRALIASAPRSCNIVPYVAVEAKV